MSLHKEIDSLISAQMDVSNCGINDWIINIAQGDWGGVSHGYSIGMETPSYMREIGPLRQALVNEFAFRAVAEDMATRAISFLVAYAPDIQGMEFYATQLIDEARHAESFRHHLLDLGVSNVELNTLYETAGVKEVLVPLEEFGLDIMRDRKDYIGGVVVLTVLVEGILAPSSELSERKWQPVDPVAAQIGHLANLDEIRHLSVGADIVKKYLQDKPQEKERILQIIHDGRELWSRLPTYDLLYDRESLYQEGIMQHRDKLEGYELIAGRPLLETTVEERLSLSSEWSNALQNTRIAYMGLEEATEFA